MGLCEGFKGAIMVIKPRPAYNVDEASYLKMEWLKLRGYQDGQFARVWNNKFGKSHGPFDQMTCIQNLFALNE